MIKRIFEIALVDVLVAWAVITVLNFKLSTVMVLIMILAVAIIYSVIKTIDERKTLNE